jgi:hypothetical protein
MWFVPVSLDRLLLDDPVPREDLKHDRRWAAARIVTQPQAGNPFLVSDPEWEAIGEAATNRGSPSHRAVDNVWLEVQATARLWQRERVPVFTLKNNVRNVIIGLVTTR